VDRGAGAGRARDRSRGCRLVAVSERDRAEEQLRLAVSRLLTQQAAEGLADQHSQSLLLALEAVGLSETPEARAMLYRTIVRRPEIVRFMQSDSGAPFDVAVSPETETLAVATQGGVVDLWDSDSGRLEGHVRVDGVPLLSTAYNESGDRLALGAEDGRVYLFDARSEEKVSELRPPRDYGPALTLAFAGERRLAAGYSGGIVIIWDTHSRRAVAKLPGPGSEAVDSLSFGSRGRRLAVSARSSAIDVWEIRDRPRLLRSQDLGPTVSEAVSLSPRGDTLAVGTVHGDVRLWDSRDWRPLASPARLPQAVSDLAFSADGAVLAIATNDSRVRLWSTRKRGWLRGPMAGHIGSVAAVSFAPSGLGLVSAGRDGNLITWDPIRRDRLAQILPVDVAREGARMAFDPGRGRVAWTTDDGRLLLAQLEASAQNGPSLSAPPQPLAGTARNSTISGLAFAPDGTQVAAGIAGGSSAAGTIQLWSTETGEPTEELQPRQAETGWATSLAFDPSGQPLAAVGLDRLSVLDRATGNWKRARLKGANAQDLVFSPDGGTLAAPVGTRGKVAIVDATTLEQATTVETGEALLVWDVAFSPDGETLAAGDDDGSVVLWDVASGRLLGPPLTATTDRLEDVVFSPDGGLLASSDVFARMQLWDVALHRSLGPSLIGAAPAFSDDGELLVSIWPGRGIAVRNLDLDFWREIACSLANRNLGEAEWDLFLGSLKSYEPTCPGLPRGRPAEAEFAVTGD
jgi:WD40 repeat protein